MRRQYEFKMLTFQGILTSVDMFCFSLIISCGDGVPVVQTQYQAAYRGGVELR